jgi:hypothetical protein
MLSEGGIRIIYLLDSVDLLSNLFTYLSPLLCLTPAVKPTTSSVNKPMTPSLNGKTAKSPISLSLFFNQTWTFTRRFHQPSMEKNIKSLHQPSVQRKEKEGECPEEMNERCTVGNAIRQDKKWLLFILQKVRIPSIIENTDILTNGMLWTMERNLTFPNPFFKISTKCPFIFQRNLFIS